MKPEQALKQLQALAQATDKEQRHAEADDILCQLLIHLGYGKIAKAYDDIEPKWYA